MYGLEGESAELVFTWTNTAEDDIVFEASEWNDDTSSWDVMSTDYTNTTRTLTITKTDLDDSTPTKFKVVATVHDIDYTQIARIYIACE